MSVAEGWLLPAIEEHYNRLDSLCEELDETYLVLLDKKSDDAPVLRAVLTHLKDARAALERAKGAIP
jgi:hypothetical protein